MTQDGTHKCLSHLEVTVNAGGPPTRGARQGDGPGPPSGPVGCPDGPDGEPLPLPPPGACRASEVLGRVGDKWSLQVIFSLGGGTRRFTDLKRGIDGISQRMLTVTLRGLERDGILTRTMYPVMPPRVDYALTPLGRTLLDAACTLISWVNAHLDEIETARAAYDARGPQGDSPFPG
jgi:DNA-binding HxlR family transcriptional regulator